MSRAGRVQGRASPSARDSRTRCGTVRCVQCPRRLVGTARTGELRRTRRRERRGSSSALVSGSITDLEYSASFLDVRWRRLLCAMHGAHERWDVKLLNACHRAVPRIAKPCDTPVVLPRSELIGAVMCDDAHFTTAESITSAGATMVRARPWRSELQSAALSR